MEAALFAMRMTINAKTEGTNDGTYGDDNVLTFRSC